MAFGYLFLGLILLSILHFGTYFFQACAWREIEELKKDLPESELKMLEKEAGVPEVVTLKETLLTQLIFALFILPFPFYSFIQSGKTLFAHSPSTLDLIIAMSGSAVAYLVCFKIMKMRTV